MTLLTLPGLGTVLLLGTGCRRQETSTAAPRASAPVAPAQSGRAPAGAPTEGGAFNRLFPPAREGPLERVFTQEKPGFALAEIRRDGKPVALISIVDVVASGGGAEKPGSRAIAGYPATDTGSRQTSVLVAGRYRVVVRSTDDSFSHDDRDHLIEKVDLKGLEALAGGAK